mmetsp:Transcript_18931/g.45209  ORF Transcript_18931/g.45209 Transcript_18931/m.45209 type:complete len:301 (-) Transcript_18931:652-1554(-)
MGGALPGSKLAKVRPRHPYVYEVHEPSAPRADHAGFLDCVPDDHALRVNGLEHPGDMVADCLLWFCGISAVPQRPVVPDELVLGAACFEPAARRGALGQQSVHRPVQSHEKLHPDCGPLHALLSEDAREDTGVDKEAPALPGPEHSGCEAVPEQPPEGLRGEEHRHPALHPAHGHWRVRAAASIRRSGCRNLAVQRDRPELRLAHVPEVALDVHELVVAEEEDDVAAGQHGLRLEALEEADDGEALRAAVDEVAGLHDDVVARPPVLALVDDAAEGEGVDRLVVVSMNVAYGDEARPGLY